MVTATKRKLSGSTDGKPILIAATSTPGTAIHTAVAGTTAGTYDEIWLWVHNTNCLEAKLEVAPGKGDVDELIKGALQFGNESQFKQLTKAELNAFLGNNPANKEGFAIIRMDGGGKYMDYELAQVGLPNPLRRYRYTFEYQKPLGAASVAISSYWSVISAGCLPRVTT